MKTHLLLPFSGSVTTLVRWSPGVASTSQEEVMGKYSGIFKPVWLLQISHDKSTDSRKLATDTFMASFFFSCSSGWAAHHPSNPKMPSISFQTHDLLLPVISLFENHPVQRSVQIILLFCIFIHSTSALQTPAFKPRITLALRSLINK